MLNFKFIIIIISLISILIIYFYYQKIRKIQNNKDITLYSRRRPSYITAQSNTLDKNVPVYSPNFIVDKYNSHIIVKLFNGGVKLNLTDNTEKNFGYVISKRKYRNISSIIATIDLTNLTRFNYINTSFYLINYSTNNKINFLETIGNKVFRSSTNYTTHVCEGENNIETENLTNIIDPTSEPFNIKIEFIYDEIPSIIISVLQNDITGIIYEEKVNYADLVQNMNEGYWLVYSLGQEYIPTFNKYTSDKVQASWEISDIKIKGRETRGVALPLN